MRNDLGHLFDAAGCAGSVHAVRLSDGAEVGYEADRPQVLASVVKVPIGLLYAHADGGGHFGARGSDTGASWHLPVQGPSGGLLAGTSPI